MPGDITPSGAEFGDWLHAVEHLLWRQTRKPLPESEFASECWLGTAPAWALLAAQRGEDGEHWCPLLDPALREREDTADDELAALLLQ